MVKPIESKQYVWWHRLRRLKRFGFILGLGGVVAPVLTGAMQVAVVTPVMGWRYGFDTFAVKTVLALSPLYIGLFAWTWSYMERRYHSTLGTRCPGCGYPTHASFSDRCSECGRPITETVPSES